MSTFQQRVPSALKFEDVARQRLAEFGWTTFEAGQGTISNEARNALNAQLDDFGRVTLMRWFPDIFAFRGAGTTFECALIEAKSCAERPNQSLEMASVEAALVCEVGFRMRTYFVFDNWNVLTPREIDALPTNDARFRDGKWEGPRRGVGSDTPYWLFGKHHGRPFVEVFGRNYDDV